MRSDTDISIGEADPALPLSEQMRIVLTGPGPDEVPLAQLIGSFQERAFGAVLLICTLPALVPVPFGVGLIVGAPPMIIALQMIMRRRTLWLPEFLARRVVNRKTVYRKAAFLLPWMARVERFSRPRLNWINKGVAGIGLSFLILLFALSIAVPLPISNSIPAFGILLIALAITEEDGLLTLVGIGIGLAGLAVTAAASFAMGAAAVMVW